MKNILIAFVLGLTVLSCQEKEEPLPILENTCGVNHPVTDLTWLVQMIEEMSENEFSRKYSVIRQFEQDAETFFILSSCCPFCNTVAVVYNCEGEQVGIISDQNGEFPSSIYAEAVTIHRFEGSECTL